MKRFFTDWVSIPAAVAFSLFCAIGVSAGVPDPRAFASPEDAVTALIAALEKNDVTTLEILLGPDSEDVVSSGDEVADANARADFVASFKTRHTLVPEGSNVMTLVVGDDDWPLPIPIVAKEGKWFLDGAAGADEIVYRRIGHNELGAIAVSRGFVDAQMEYVTAGHDGNEPGIFAAKLRSDPGQQNGLYWPTAAGETPSPAGEAIARAAAEGYKAVTGKRKPYHGYYYRMLFAQGANANGGAKEYFVDGQLTQGVALLAWPADYQASGVMSFMVDDEGIVYQKDLGEDTASVAESIQVFDPDGSWTIVDSENDS
jgi:Protein of unknown function (DUF2950)